MGNITRAMSYSITKNEQSAISVLKFNGKPLSWFRLDDGVMGGQSETVHVVNNRSECGILHSKGKVNQSLT